MEVIQNIVVRLGEGRRSFDEEDEPRGELQMSLRRCLQLGKTRAKTRMVITIPSQVVWITSVPVAKAGVRG